jgi:YbgC/YbaW family acyl-CoA thioester hydrolase
MTDGDAQRIAASKPHPRIVAANFAMQETKPPMKRSNFRFFHRLRVRWAEVDMQSVVFNAHYLMYFSVAITDYWRAMGIEYDETMARLNGEIFVKKSTLEFNASARMDDLLDVAIRCERIGTSTIQLAGAVFQGEQVLVTYDMLYVFTNRTTQKSSPVPESFRRVIHAYNGGRSMEEVHAAAAALVSEAQAPSQALRR